jgi:hypothetical protein
MKYSPNIIRIMKLKGMRWEGHVAHMREKTNTYSVLAGKLPLGRLRRMWEDNIKMDLIREVGWGGMDWIHLAQYND